MKDVQNRNEQWLMRDSKLFVSEENSHFFFTETSQEH